MTEPFNPTDLELAYNALSKKANIYTEYWNYYDGDHPQYFLSQRLKDLFQGIDVNFSENWCAVVIDSMLERIMLNGLQVANDETAANGLKTLWDDLELKFEAEEVHEMTLVTGEGFLIIWQDKWPTNAETATQLQVYANDSRLCHAIYDNDDPRQMRFAAKMWLGADKHYRLTLYYTDRLEYYRSKSEAKKTRSAKDFIPLEATQEQPNPALNPFEQIPVFHFRTSRRKIKSELKSAVDPQAVINKTLNDMMATLEFAAFPQKYVISNGEFDVLKSAPGEIWELPAGDGVSQATQVGQFAPANPNGYLAVIDREANVISAVTRTPKHYFFSQGSVPSGEALMTLEAPLNKKCQNRLDRFAATWKRAATFMLKLRGKDIAPGQITPLYAKPETLQPKTQAEIRQIEVNTGIPLVTALKDEGWDAPKIEEMLQDKEAESLRQQKLLATAVLEAQDQLNSGGQDDGTSQPN